MKLFLLALLPAVLAQNIVDLAVATPQLSTLVGILTNPAYKSVLTALSGPGPFTVFAPTDEAFTAAGVDVNDVAAVTNVLQYHVLQGAVMAKDLAASQAPTMLNGARAIIKASSAGVTAAGARVVIADVAASNGVVHVIDKVMLPPSSSVVGLAVATPVVSKLVTVLTMPAFKGILDALSGNGPFTVFAPTNDAFAAAGVDISDTDTVSAVLKYHVLQGAVYSDDLAASQEVVTLNGAKLNVRKSASGVTVNAAKVVVADVAGTNGVVHVIDKVLLPPTSAKAAPVMTTTTAPAVYSAAPSWGSLYSVASGSYSVPYSASSWGGYYTQPFPQTSFASTPVYSAAPVPLYSATAPAPMYSTAASSWGGYFAPSTPPFAQTSFASNPVFSAAYNYAAPVSSTAFNNWNFGGASTYSSPFVSTGFNGWGLSTPYSTGLGGWGSSVSSPYTATWGYSGFGR